MKPMIRGSQRLMSTLLLTAMIGFLAGCASKPQVDWTSRMGIYTYEQAVSELGPPTKEAKLADGKIVADWTTRTQSGPSFGVGVGGYGSSTGLGMGTSYGGAYRERTLRLTFGTDGKLENWTRNY